jgi:L-amino acid N-acyltransferase YncA
MSLKKKLDPIDPSFVELIPASGSRRRGGGPVGEAWIVKAHGKRAGTAYINIVEDLFRGKHASFHIFLNKTNQGRKIGRRAYQLACTYSQYSTIYAHMRKSNIASYKAAIYAGFVDATLPGEKQLVLAWSRHSI